MYKMPNCKVKYGKESAQKEEARLNHSGTEG